MKIGLLIGACALALAASSAQAGTVLTYKFDPGSTFDFGGGNTYAAVGTFDFDVDTLQVVGVAYSGVQIGTGPIGPFDFTIGVANSPTSVTFSGDCCGDINTFEFASSLAGGGTIAIVDFRYGVLPGQQLPVTGSVTAQQAAVPEPATWGMMILGLGLAGAALRRRAARVSVAFG
jgi:hypothetical protein